MSDKSIDHVKRLEREADGVDWMAEKRCETKRDEDRHRVDHSLFKFKISILTNRSAFDLEILIPCRSFDVVVEILCIDEGMSNKEKWILAFFFCSNLL